MLIKHAKKTYIFDYLHVISLKLILALNFYNQFLQISELVEKVINNCQQIREKIKFYLEIFN